MNEIWRDVPGYEGFYEVSDRGRVRSVERAVVALSRSGNPYTRTWKTHLLKPAKDGHGYLFFQASREGLVKQVWLHRAICGAFHGSAPSGRAMACHNDGCKTNNDPDNLRWDSGSGNQVDRALHGTASAKDISTGRFIERRA